MTQKQTKMLRVLINRATIHGYFGFVEVSPTFQPEFLLSEGRLSVILTSEDKGLHNKSVHGRYFSFGLSYLMIAKQPTHHHRITSDRLLSDNRARFLCLCLDAD